jgi:uncharacterized protein
MIGIATAMIISVTSVATAIPIDSVPNPRVTDGSWISDTADLITPTTEAQLNQAITKLESRTRHEISVVTVPDIYPATSPKSFATELFNTWGIGKQSENNGVLILVSQADRRVEIITGKGMKTLLPESQVSQLIQQKMIPQFSQGDFDRGIAQGTQAIIQSISFPVPKISVTPLSPPQSQTRSRPHWFHTFSNIFWWCLGAVVILLVAIIPSPRRTRSWNSSDSYSDNNYGSYGDSSFSSYNDNSSSSYSDDSSSSYSNDSSSSNDSFGGGSSDGSGSGDSW